MAKVLVYANRADKLAELVSFARTLGSECLALACGPELPEGFGSSGADATILLKGSSARPEDYSRSIAEFISAENIDIFAAVSTPTAARSQPMPRAASAARSSARSRAPLLRAASS